MQTRHRNITAALGALLALSASVNVWQLKGARNHGQVTTDTVRVTSIDTVPYYMPVARESVIVRTVTARMKVQRSIRHQDTLAQAASVPDSAEIIIPITQKEYQDSDYRAWVSGYDARLDSITVYRRTNKETVTTVIRDKAPRLSVGISAGMGAGKDGFTPYVGIGVNYRLLSFPGKGSKRIKGD